jgi:NADH-quinone oxidoreductase subunit N
MPAPVFTAADNLVLLPAIVMALFACGILMLDVIGKSSVLGRRWLMLFSLLGLAITATALWRQWLTLSASGLSQFTAAQGAITLDGLGFFSNTLVWGSTVLLFLTSYRFLEFNRENKGEYLGLAFLAEAGMYFMAAAAELVTLFLGIELTAISFYVLVGFTRADKRSNEAALKYLLLGALSSGFILYGFSILYGISGSTGLTEISLAVSQRGAHDPFVILAVVPIVAGVLFKISAVPFHTWAPDAYDGAPTPVTAYLSVASKVAAFAVLLRLLPLTLSAVRSVWEPLLVIAAVASITVGSIAALTQIRLKRFFAYSSIAHMGYILLGVIAGTEMGWKGVYIYLLIYALMTQGAFTLLISLTRRGIAGEKFGDLRGLSTTHPLHSALFVVLLLSLAGIPPTAGFIGKYFIFVALIETHHYALAVIAAAYVVVSLYIYFRLVREMYFKNAETREPLASSLGIRLSLYATSALTLFIGVFPEPVLRLGFRIAGIGQ